MFEVLKRVLVGRPIATEQQEHQRISKKVALAVFSSDAISSTSYATQEILLVTALGASSLALGLDSLIPIAIAVAVLIAIVVTSYRQTIFAYPNGGGSYLVSKENLGSFPSLVAGASILLDYVLTVAVSISAGVAAIVSIPSFREAADSRVTLCLILVGIITLANLRGVKESGQIFAAPTYLYIVMISLLVGYGLFREFFGTPLEHVEFDPEYAEHMKETGGTLTLFLLLKGFSSGAVALTGIEAISDGVPAFKKPAAQNAAKTLVLMAVILGSLFFGVSVLAHHLRPVPLEHGETVFSQMGRAVFGEGPLYLLLQFATAGILVLAANTAYADFPRLSSVIARDGFLPRQFANRGDRLVFSNGIFFLALAAGGLLVAFDGVTTKLIPLYAVGVFTSFTLSQTGMMLFHIRGKENGWRRRAAISGTGAFITFGVLLIVAGTKFTSGAWVSIVVVAAIVSVFLLIRSHYVRIQKALAVTPASVRPESINHTVVVLVGRIHKGVLKAIRYARSLNADHLVALYVSDDDEAQEAMLEKWELFGIDVPLEIIRDPYRELIEPVERFLDDLEGRRGHDTVTVVIPEFVVEHWYENILHNQTALQLKLSLLNRRGTVVASVPYHVRSADQAPTA